MKILYLDNVAAHYRKAIFLLMDQTFIIDYLFGEDLGDIKQMDTTLLRGTVCKTKNKKVLGRWYWQSHLIKKLFDKYDAYLLIGATYALSTWAFLFLSCIVGKRNKIFLWTHGWYGKESRIERLLKKIFLRLPNGGVFLYGNYARDLMIKEGFNPEKLFVIHNSLDYDRQVEIRKELCEQPIYKDHFRNDNPNLFFVGRLTEVKKLDLVLKAMALLRESGQCYNMTFIGDGIEKGFLRELTKELGLEQYVWFYGECYDEKLLGNMIYNADLCVAPGNIGLTAMHTLVFGTPAITHSDFAHQMPEFEAIREGETGRFFIRNSVESLANSICKWFEEKKEKREEVRQACMQEIERSWTPQYQISVLIEHLM